MKEIKLSGKHGKGKAALVDDHWYDYLMQWKWWAIKGAGNNYYAQRKQWVHRGCRKAILMHRVILGLTDPKIFGEHENGNGVDNQENNLRIATHSQNMMNRKKKSNSSSKYIGVGWYKPYGKWYARIEVNKKSIFIGYFINEDDAARSRNAAAIIHHGKFARLNIIPGDVQKLSKEKAA